MKPDRTTAGWEEYPDDALLHALTEPNHDALLELHRRYAGHLYALAGREHPLDLERRVQDAWLFILRHAHCYTRSSLTARQWVLVMGHRALTTRPGLR